MNKESFNQERYDEYQAELAAFKTERIEFDKDFNNRFTKLDEELEKLQKKKNEIDSQRKAYVTELSVARGRNTKQTNAITAKLVDIQIAAKEQYLEDNRKLSESNEQLEIELNKIAKQIGQKRDEMQSVNSFFTQDQMDSFNSLMTVFNEINERIAENEMAIQYNKRSIIGIEQIGGAYVPYKSNKSNALNLYIERQPIEEQTNIVYIPSNNVDVAKEPINVEKPTEEKQEKLSVNNDSDSDFIVPGIPGYDSDVTIENINFTTDQRRDFTFTVPGVSDDDSSTELINPQAAAVTEEIFNSAQTEPVKDEIEEPEESIDSSKNWDPALDVPSFMNNELVTKQINEKRLAGFGEQSSEKIKILREELVKTLIKFSNDLVTDSEIEPDKEKTSIIMFTIVKNGDEISITDEYKGSIRR